MILVSIRAALGYAKLSCPILKRFAERIRSAEVKRNETAVLILGSSHAWKGYRARKGEFNLGCDFQDLHTSLGLYRRFRDSTSLRTVVITYSVFSRGHNTLLTRDAENVLAFKVLANVNYRDSNVAQRLGLPAKERTAIRKARKHLSKVPYDPLDVGNDRNYCSVYASVPAAERAAGHLKNNRRAVSMDCCLRELRDMVRHDGRRLLIVIPPASPAYRKALPPKKELFPIVDEFNETEVLDLYDADGYGIADFIDADHLSLSGAAKMTQSIRECLGMPL